jgi:hypothetical protein
MASYSDRIKRLSKVVQLNARCRACGSMLFSMGKDDDIICTFCESYANQTDYSVDFNPEIKDSILAMNKALMEGAWLDGVKFADAVAATNDQYGLYGAATFYSAFSNHTYADVNYNLGGFMYENAAKRSDELKKNPYNAMALTSKSRGYFYRVLKVIEKTSDDDPHTAYLEFITNIKLGRKAQAALAIDKIKATDTTGMLINYAMMVYAERTVDKKAINYIIKEIDNGQVSAFYYLADHLKRERDFAMSKSLLTVLTNSLHMYTALALFDKVVDLERAMDA